MNFDIEKLMQNPNDLQRRVALVVLFPPLLGFVLAYELAEKTVEIVTDCWKEAGQVWKEPLQ